MSRSDIDEHFSKIDELVEEIEEVVPSGTYRSIKFRADLAGLLVVAISATYENCVKMILCEYATRQHQSFGQFATRNFDRLNSRIKVSDLVKYCEVFDPQVCARFKDQLARRKRKLLERTGKNIQTSYEQILNWRHDFAHARIQSTTIEEAVTHHRFGKRVIYIFDGAFS